MTYAAAKFCAATSNGLRGDVFIRKHIITSWPVTWNVGQYPIYHATHLGTRFEVTTSNSLGGDEFMRKFIL